MNVEDDTELPIRRVQVAGVPLAGIAPDAVIWHDEGLQMLLNIGPA
jgi:hypothetical protein